MYRNRLLTYATQELSRVPTKYATSFFYILEQSSEMYNTLEYLWCIYFKIILLFIVLVGCAMEKLKACSICQW